MPAKSANCGDSTVEYRPMKLSYASAATLNATGPTLRCERAVHRPGDPGDAAARRADDPRPGDVPGRDRRVWQAQRVPPAEAVVPVCHCCLADGRLPAEDHVARLYPAG